MSFDASTLTSAPAFAGLSFGLAFMLSLGPQNTHLIRQGLCRNFALTTATVGYLSDVVLVFASLAGFSSTLMAQPGLNRVFGWLGVAFLAACGVRGLINGAVASPRFSTSAHQRTCTRAIATMLAMTWANPLYYVEVLIPFGLLSTRFGGARGAYLFAFGMLAASFIRFYGYSLAASRLARFFGQPGALRAFEKVAGAVLLVLAAAATVAMTAVKSPE